MNHALTTREESNRTRRLSLSQRASPTSSLAHREAALVFDDRSFFESLRLEGYYGYAAEQVTAASGFLRGLVRETRARR
jgi:hypothetical protein